MHKHSTLDNGIELIIFDCDGVLVDSEGIENQMLIDMASNHGLVVDADDAHRFFVGRKLADCVKHMEIQAGRALPHSFIDDYRRRLSVVIERDLKPIQGVRQALQQIKTMKCVASNGPRHKIELALRVTELREHFADRLFSAYDVGAWKPEPDLFLHAADALKVNPCACVVIEDSRLGIEAAVAAGMRVIAYAPEGGNQLAADEIHSMDDLPEYIRSTRLH